MSVKNIMYEIKMDIIYILIVIAITFAVWGILIKFGNDLNIMLFDVIMMNGIFFGRVIHGQIEQHMNFAFCRKSILKKQLILSVVKSVLLSIVRTCIQIIFYDNFVEMFMEDTDHTLSMYHRVPVVELFVGNFMVFMILYIVNVILATSNRFVSQQIADTPQLRWRTANKKKLNIILKAIIFVAAIILLVAVEFGVVAYYWFQMIYPFAYRLLISLGIAALLAAICYLAKRRYSPNYI